MKLKIDTHIHTAKLGMPKAIQHVPFKEKRGLEAFICLSHMLVLLLSSVFKKLQL